MEAGVVVTAGQSHTSPLPVEIRSGTLAMLRFYLSKNRQKVLLQPTAALPGSILSLQEVVTLFWKRRPIIFRRTRLMLLIIGALLHLRLCSRDVTKISSSSQLKVPHQRWHSSLTYNDGYWMVAELFNK